MTRASLAALAALAAPGCIVYTDGHPPAGDPVANDPPYITYAEAGCYWDGYYADYIWYFEIEVDDPDTAWDVVAVYADVYDDWDGSPVDSFELYPTDDPTWWFSDWLGRSTWLDCGYGGYSVEFWAYDSYDAADAVVVDPYLYP